MKKFNFLFGCLVLCGTLAMMSCNDDLNDCAEISAPIITKTLALDDFHSVIMEGVGDVLLTQGSPQSVRIETHQEFLDKLSLNVTNGELFIELTGCTQGQVDRIDIFITIPEIKRLRLDGVGNFTVQNDFDLDELDVDLNGVGNLTLRGRTDYFNVNSSGVGNIHAYDFLANTCDLVISGIGSAQVTVVDELNVTISGNGNVFYKGNPTISANISGNGKLTDAN